MLPEIMTSHIGIAESLISMSNYNICKLPFNWSLRTLNFGKFGKFGNRGNFKSKFGSRENLKSKFEERENLKSTFEVRVQSDANPIHSFQNSDLCCIVSKPKLKEIEKINGGRL